MKNIRNMILAIIPKQILRQIPRQMPIRITHILHICFSISIMSMISFMSEAHTDRWQGITFFSPRSQGENAVRNIVGRHPFIHQPDSCDNYLTINSTVEYHHSFRPARIAHVLFGTDKLIISGSEVSSPGPLNPKTHRGPDDILADYFGLSTKFQSTICMDPFIQWFTFNYSLYAGLDHFIRGLYLNIHIPVVWTKWGLQFSEIIHAESENTDYPAGYMDIDPTPVGATSFLKALKGNTTFGTMQDPLKYGKICGSKTESGLADVHLMLGWDITSSQRGYAGFNLQVVAPTGTRPDSQFLFEPIVGNGRHWQVGAGFSGRSLIWEEGGVQELSFFADVNLSHFLKSHQRRSFDLKKIVNLDTESDACCDNSCDSNDLKEINYGSRYMLFKDFTAPLPAAINLTPVINHTTLCCTVDVAFQMDTVFMFGYTYQDFIFDIGYNGWIRSKERICLTNKQPFTNTMYGLKGIQQVTTPGPIHVASLDTEHLAMIVSPEITGIDTFPTVQMALADANPPVFTPSALIDKRSAASPMVLTHKFFTHVGWQLCSFQRLNLTHTIGLGGEIEFEGLNERGSVQLNKNTLSQWGVWAYSTLNF